MERKNDLENQESVMKKPPQSQYDDIATGEQVKEFVPYGR